MTEDTCISNFFKDASQEPMESLDESIENMLSLSQLTLEENQPIDVPQFYNITPRLLPLSPHYIFEENFSRNPWALLITTIFLTKTSGKIARPYLKSFFETYPTPYHVLDDNPRNLERFFDNLGLKKRSEMIWKLSYQFISAKWSRASDLFGVGKYGEDAYRIFCLGHTDVDPNDRYLRLYLDWLTGHTEYLEDAGVVDSEYVIEDPVLEYYRLSLKDG